MAPFYARRTATGGRRRVRRVPRKRPARRAFAAPKRWKRKQPVRKKRFGNDITNVRLFRSAVLSRTLTWTHIGYLGPIDEAAYQRQTWNLASLYKPNYSASDVAVPPDPTNTSVAQLAELQGDFAQYRVGGVLFKCKVWNPGNMDILVQLSVNAATTPDNTTNMQAVPGQSQSVNRLVLRAAAGNLRSCTYFKVWCPIHKILEVSKNRYSSESAWWAFLTGNPAHGAYLHMQAWGVGAGGTASLSTGDASEEMGLGNEDVMDLAQLGDPNAPVDSGQGAIGFAAKLKYYCKFSKASQLRTEGHAAGDVF